MNEFSYPHVPVLLSEVMQAFQPCRLKVFVDGTLGAGGHAQSILQAHPEIDIYVGIDRDPQALALASERLEPWHHKLVLKHGNFADFDHFLCELKLQAIDGLLVDLGASSMQFDQPERGFSFSQNGPLDMRMNPAEDLTAAEVINTWPEQELGRIFREYGEEKRWRMAARLIVEARQQKPILTTFELAKVWLPHFSRNPKKRINPLTLLFQALRISVNHELESLEIFMSKATKWLSPSGRLAVISFHSLEDRIVKNSMRLAASDKWETSGIGGLFRDKRPSMSLITKKPIVPTEQEVSQNLRSRSAKLRVAQQLPLEGEELT